MWGSNPFTNFSSQPQSMNTWGAGNSQNSGSFNPGAFDFSGGGGGGPYGSGYPSSMGSGSSMPSWMTGGSGMPSWMGNMGGGSQTSPWMTGGMGGGSSMPPWMNSMGGGGMNYSTMPMPWQQPQGGSPQMQYGPPGMNTPTTDYFGSPPGGGAMPGSRSTSPFTGPGFSQGNPQAQPTDPMPPGGRDGVFDQVSSPTMLQGPTAAMMGYGASPWQGAQYNVQAGRWM